MAIFFETSSYTNSTLTGSNPIGTAAGNLLVGLACSDSITGIPSGWTEIEKQKIWNNATLGDYFSLCYYFVVGAPPATYSWAGTTDANSCVQIQRFSGVASYGGIATQNNGPGTTNTAPTVTPDEDNCLVMWIGAGYHAGSPATPGSYTNLIKQNKSGRADTVLASLVQVAATPTGAVAASGWSNYSLYDQFGMHVWFREGVGATPAGYRRMRMGGGING